MTSLPMVPAQYNLGVAYDNGLGVTETATLVVLAE